MENFEKLKWLYNSTPVATDEKINFYYSFNDCGTKDIVFCHLNEIDPMLLDDNEELDNLSAAMVSDHIIDPRNNNIIHNLTNDFSEKCRFERRSNFFKNFPQVSTLSREEHIACLRYLKAKKQKKEPKGDDVKAFEQTKDKREAEYKIYSDFIRSYVLANPYKSFKDFEILYRNILQYFEKTNLSDVFGLEAGLPILSNITPKNEVSWECNQTLVSIQGFFPSLKKYFDIYKIRIDLVSYLNNLDEFLSHPFKNNIKHIDTEYDLRISEQALSLIMGISNETDYEIEIPIDIKNSQITIFQPLPSRYFNNNTNTFVFDILLRNFINKRHKNSYKKFENGSYLTISNNTEVIDAVDLAQNYKLHPIDKYLKKSYVEDFMSNHITSKITLNESNTEPVNVLIDFKNMGYLDDNNKIVNLSCKLEYKKKFGFEKMTSNELLTEYIRAYFIPNSSTVRYRIDADTFEVVDSSKVTKNEIADDLLELYNMKISVLLSKLQEFVRMLKNFPDGSYFLKYSPKFNGKFFVYGKNNLVNAKTISIESLYKNVGLTIQNNFIPIDNTLCIRVVHDVLKIIPGCFPPWGKCKKKSTFSNDRDKIIKKALDEKDKKEKTLLEKKRKSKQQKKRLKRLKRQKIKSKIAKVVEEEDELKYTNSLIEKYAESRPINTDYFTLSQENNKKISKVNDDFNLDKYLSEAAGPSSCQKNLTREEYLEMKKTNHTKFVNSSEIESRKANLICKNSNGIVKLIN
ncbi:little elongation complex subunit 2 [Condylostylus longicornis]|uniref:little elongation complex subunit 2 n=1 Tax=Condylostylus longicornis TaxID=2530218 RepID=UPI00244DEDD0|nr:little elongation complex subunit 2 [Condylostylus longicornis]